MNQLTTMSLCLLATFGVLILQVNGDDTRIFEEFTPCYRATEQMSDCMHEVVDQLAIREELDHSSRVCYKLLGTFSSCKGLYEKLTFCYSPLQKSLISSAGSLLRSIHEFFCNLAASDTILYTEGNGPECLASKKTEIKNCINQFLLPSNTTNELSKTEEKCVKLVGFESCVMGHLSQCPLPGGVVLADSIFENEKSNSGCKSNSDHVSS